MKGTKVFLIILYFIRVLEFPLIPLEKFLLKDISNNISAYKGRSVTLKLRLKRIDNVFDKLTFYDRKNYDIIFDITELKTDEEFKRYLLNIHEGMNYFVKFIVRKVDDFGNIIGDLISFEPVALLKLPEGLRNNE